MLQHSMRSSPAPVTAKVERVTALTPTVRLLQLRTESPFPYRAGQYVSLILPDGARRSLSPANAPNHDGLIDFHVQLQPGGALSRWLSEHAAPGDHLAIEGPYGDCTWRRAPALMLATGTGVAPLLALLQENFAAPNPQAVTLFWGARTAADLYAAAILEALARQHSNFRFVPILSPTHVQDAAAFPDLSALDVYACGSPRMVEAARAKLAPTAAAFHADAFEPAIRTSPAPDAPRIAIGLRGFRAMIVPTGETLLTALTTAGAPIGSVCGGQASCGTCRLAIDPAWLDRLPPAKRNEQRLLNCLAGAAPHHRLACQITLGPAHAGLVCSLDPPGI